jgi:Raf kinase inhibitor-like YbhB/YbcL family protein
MSVDGARRGVAVAAWALLAVAATSAPTPEEEGRMAAFQITSPSFQAMGEIPRRHTCEGEDVSPELRWSGVPEGTRSLVLIVEDPDAPDPRAPKMTWVHWVLYDIPPDATGLPEGLVPDALPPGTRQGLNDWKRTGYGGPCPPIGRHRYFHRVYALDVELGDLGRPTRVDLQRAMRDRVLAEAELVGTYQKGD